MGVTKQKQIETFVNLSIRFDNFEYFILIQNKVFNISTNRIVDFIISQPHIEMILYKICPYTPNSYSSMFFFFYFKNKRISYFESALNLHLKAYRLCASNLCRGINFVGSFSAPSAKLQI